MEGDEYPTCANTRATFRLFWRGDPALRDVTALLGREPTDRSDHATRGRSWRLSTRDAVSSRDVRVHVDWLLAWLSPRAAEVAQLRERGLRADIFCYWLSKHGHGGPMLSAPQLTGLAALEMDIGFDVYWVGTPTAGRPTAEDPLLRIDLTPAERALLIRGLFGWGGPTRCTEEMAVALGFSGVTGLSAGARRLGAALQADQPLSAIDWARVFSATEVVFASQLVGSGLEWSITTGYTDEETLALLRSAQRKLPSAVFAVIGDGFGSRPVLGARNSDGPRGGPTP